MHTWDQVLTGIEATLAGYCETAATGVAGADFLRPDQMPAPSPAEERRIDALLVRLGAVIGDHERELAGLRTSLAAATRSTAGETGSLIDERA
jgi:hypothetical protein